jgi:hypothetical protein
MRPAYVVTSWSVVIVVVSCALPPPDEGGRCAESSDCSDDVTLQCVRVDDDDVCLPTIVREPTVCAGEDDCFEALFPVESECIEAVCRCPDTSSCAEGTFDVFACACIVNDNGFCTSDEDCAAGLNCEDNACTRGNAPGDACSAAEPCSGDDLSCLCSVGDDDCVIGTCLRDEGGECGTSADCGRVIFCVNDRCSDQAGSTGDGCGDDDDCDFFACEEGVCG